MFPISYQEPLFRPPSEARSLILQVTYGCSWNKCAFCDMYSDKPFKVRKESDVFKDIDAFIPYKASIRRIFLADGDAMVLSTEKLIRILDKLKNTFPRLTRISTYASPDNIAKKSLSELQELKEAGLNLLYVGIESGDNKVLEAVNKGETFESTVSALNLSRKAGLNSSVMIITGLGGKILSKEHAINSAKILNETQPKYASTLVLNNYKGLEHYQSRYIGKFVLQNQVELLEEMLEFIAHTELKETIYRSDHASNYLALKGVLGRDKERFLSQINNVLSYQDYSKLRK